MQLHLSGLTDMNMPIQRFYTGGVQDTFSLYSQLGNDTELDVDIMVVLPFCCAITPETQFVAPLGVSVVTFVTSGVHLGYARLMTRFGIEFKQELLFLKESLDQRNDYTDRRCAMRNTTAPY